MLKRRLIAILAGLALLLAVAGVSGVVADSVGLDATAPAHACNTSGSSGGC
jgi:hypothetical protein